MPGQLLTFEFVDLLENQIAHGWKLVDLALEESGPGLEDIQLVETSLLSLESEIADLSVQGLDMAKIDELNQVSGLLHHQLLKLAQTISGK